MNSGKEATDPQDEKLIKKHKIVEKSKWKIFLQKVKATGQ